jgi:DNA sulfur modification protein DndB
MATPKADAKTERKALEVNGILLKEDPHVYLAAIPGRWLLAHATPSWRIEDPQQGFQRIVKEQRAKEIARTVIDTHRAFPNAVTLATDRKQFSLRQNKLELAATTKFLVVDGQHRLYAQKYSRVEAQYPCIIHMDRTEQEMAALFLEINDNQRRVPSSLRWDLVRLVRSEDKSTQMTSDIVFELATRRESPFNTVGIDLTGENKDLTIKQGSLAPEIRTLLRKNLKKHDAPFDDYLELLIRFFVAIRSVDPDGWGDARSPFFRARVLRALLRVLSDLLYEKSFAALTTEKLLSHLKKIKLESLSDEELRRAQGSAGVQDLYKTISSQIAAG